MRPLAAAILASAVLLAGCASPDGGRANNGAAEPEPFRLRVLVVGAVDGAGGIAGARIVADAERGDDAESVTDASGAADLELERLDRVTLRVSADGWLDEQTVGVLTGRSGPASFLDGLGEALACAFTFGAVCIVDDEVVLDGTSATVRVLLVPPTVESSATVQTSPGAHPAPAGAAEAPAWWAAPLPLATDGGRERFLLQRVTGVDVTMTWTNALMERGDYELGVGCSDAAPDEATTSDSGVAHLVSEGEQSITHAWTPPVAPPDGGPRNVGWTSVFMEPGCARLHAGPVEDSATSGTDVAVHAVVALAGGVQLPEVVA